MARVGVTTGFGYSKISRASSAPAWSRLRAASSLEVMMSRWNPAEKRPGRPASTTARPRPGPAERIVEIGGDLVGDGVGLAIVEGDDGDAVLELVLHGGLGHDQDAMSAEGAGLILRSERGGQRLRGEPCRAR